MLRIPPLGLFTWRMRSTYPPDWKARSTWAYGTMLAEYLAPLPMAMVCTIAVCTGSGRVSAEFCCLHAVAASVRAVAIAVSQSLKAVGFIASLFPKSFFKGSLCIPEGKQALFIVVVGAGHRRLLLKQIA